MVLNSLKAITAKSKLRLYLELTLYGSVRFSILSEFWNLKHSNKVLLGYSKIQ